MGILVGSAHGSPGADAANALGVDLFRKVAAKPGNCTISPASIALALGMTHAGAKGETAAEMARVLHLPAGADSALPDLGRELQSAGAEGCQLAIANAIWPASGSAIDPAYLARIQDYQGAVTPLDYAADVEAARGTINAWVSEKTQSKIPQLLPPRSINAGTPMVLTNAVYFKGDWQEPFEKSATRPGLFMTGDGQSVQVPLMSALRPFKCAQVGGVKVLELPYKCPDLAMTIVLPTASGGIRAVQESLSAAKVQSWVDALSSAKASVLLPKFEVRWHASLIQPLIDLGLKTATSDAADFSAMRVPPPPIKIGDVIHETYMLVDEQGTEAAAATAVIMAPGSAAMPVEGPFEFHVDRPFLVLLRHVPSGAILFLGRISDPRS